MLTQQKKKQRKNVFETHQNRAAMLLRALDYFVMCTMLNSTCEESREKNFSEILLSCFGIHAGL